MKKAQTPQWFTDSLELGERFVDEIRISPEYADEWVKTLYDAWISPETRPELLNLWATLSQEDFFAQLL